MNKKLEKSVNLKKSDIHKGHRQRLKEKYINNGLDSFEFHEILELLLFCPLHRKNTNEIGHEMAKNFDNSFAEIFDASDERLKEISGIGDEAVLHIRFLADITRIYNIDRAKRAEKDFESLRAQEEYLIANYTGKRREEVFLITLNNRMERISCDLIHVGSVNASNIVMNKMVKIALNNDAASVIVAHNHPNGRIEPSRADIETTRRMEWVFDAISLNFIDHYVIADTKIASIKEKSREIYK
jgi:DNA repair protein RadC